jgi:hypothetical protein
MNLTKHFPTLAWFSVGAMVVYSLAPFVAKWLLIAVIVGVILVGMWIAGTRFDLEA